MTIGNTTFKNLNFSLKNQEESFKKISSGKRINSAKDDPAGLAIAASLNSNANLRSQANRNISDSISALSITEGALAQVSDIAGRLAELSAQASNGTLSDSQRDSLQKEYSELSSEIQRIDVSTEFNGVNLLSGTSFTTQSGINSSDSSKTEVNTTNLSSLSSSVSSQNISTQEGARNALEQVAGLISSLASARGSIGATTSRLDFTYRNNLSQKENEIAASSRISDANIAEETSNLNRSDTLAKISISSFKKSDNLSGNITKKLLGVAK